jgi:hypothetical protein
MPSSSFFWTFAYILIFDAPKAFQTASAGQTSTEVTTFSAATVRTIPIFQDAHNSLVGLDPYNGFL